MFTPHLPDELLCFSDSRRILRRQAAEAAGVKVNTSTSHVTGNRGTRHTLHVTRYTSPAMLNANSVVTHTNSERRAAAHRDV